VKVTLDEGERINAFWAVLTMYKTVSVAFDSPLEVCGMFEAPGLSIDTPWPLDMDAYKEGILPSPSNGNTVNTYLTQMKREGDSSSSPRPPYAALVAKSSTLFHRATYLSGQYTPNTPSQTFYTAYEFLLRTTEELRASIPSIPDLDPTSPTARTVNLVLALVYGTLIKLHGTFANSDMNSRHTWIGAARAMLTIATVSADPAMQNAHPVMGTILSQACQVLIHQIDFYQDLRARGDTSLAHVFADQPSEKDLTNELQQGLHSLSQYPRESAILSKSSQFRINIYENSRKVLYRMMEDEFQAPPPPPLPQTQEYEYGMKMEDLSEMDEEWFLPPTRTVLPAGGDYTYDWISGPLVPISA
jgi:hypothetical protein